MEILQKMGKEAWKHSKIKKILAKVNFGGLYILGAAFCVFMVALVLLEANVKYKIRPESLELPEKETLASLKTGAVYNGKIINVHEDINKGDRCLLILEEGDPQSLIAKRLWQPVLDQMKITYDICDAVDFEMGRLDRYSKVVIAVTKYQKLSGDIAGIKDWVKHGGNLMIAYPPEFTGSYQSLYDILGVKESGDASVVEGLHFNNGFMIGGTAHDYYIIDAYESALGYSLQDDCEVYVQSTDEYPVPLIWRRKCGAGSVVVDNFGILDKAYRGIHCSAFSLLGDSCLYPVINGAAFYIDDFPSPVPEGDSAYVTRDYNLSVSDFYSQVWWNDLYDLGKKYGINYTGLVIEDYSNKVSGEFPRNLEIARFQYFGNMLLDAGGEIGIHGYNHMPLCLENFDYKDQYDAYIQWPSTMDMKRALDEVFAFTKELFPDEELQVYVPPSNVLSKEGRALLNDTSIRCVAAVYLPVDMSFEQEFDVSDDGIINTPRITSGCVIDEYMELSALSELNFHLVNTHFHHPDDVLDEERGAALGWRKLYSNLKEYFDWLYTSFPDIRNLTGSELAAAVERYDLITVDRSYADNEIDIKLGNFNDEAWMLLRLNNGESIDSVTNGGYSKVADNLYLIECRADTVSVRLK